MCIDGEHQENESYTAGSSMMLRLRKWARAGGGGVFFIDTAYRGSLSRVLEEVSHPQSHDHLRDRRSLRGGIGVELS